MILENFLDRQLTPKELARVVSLELAGMDQIHVFRNSEGVVWVRGYYNGRLVYPFRIKNTDAVLIRIAEGRI